MFRKLGLVAVAAVSLGTAALTPAAAADLDNWHGGWRGSWQGSRYGHYRGWDPRVVAPVSYGYGACYTRQLLPTPWGPRWRLVNCCY